MSRFAGKQAIVWGLGRHGGGVAVTRYLARLGASVCVVDSASAESLCDSIASLDGLDGVTVHCETEPEAVISALGVTPDLLVVNPAIPLGNESLARFRRDHSRCQVTSEIELLLGELAGWKIVAVTGSNGKSSVCQWIVRLLNRVAPDRQVALGGNFESGLCCEAPMNLLERSPFDEAGIAVLELSSFQLAHLPIERLAPEVAAITNVSPNHLEWHGSLEAYVAAKERLIEASCATGTPFVLPADPADLLGQRWREHPNARVPEVLPGPNFEDRVDRLNAATVRSVVRKLGYSVSTDDLQATHPDVPHRRQLIATIGAVSYIDDSAATTPESVEALLERYHGRTEERLVLIAGGRNKGFDLASFAKRLATAGDATAAIGETGVDLARLIKQYGGDAEHFDSLEAAVEWGRAVVGERGTIALSPGMASIDMFADYRHRARRFRQIVLEE